MNEVPRFRFWNYFSSLVQFNHGLGFTRLQLCKNKTVVFDYKNEIDEIDMIQAFAATYFHF